MSQARHLIKLDEYRKTLAEVWQYQAGPTRPFLAEVPLWPEEYELVALVDTQDLAAAYELTAETPDGWRQPQVELLSPYGWDVVRLPVNELALDFYQPRAIRYGDVFAIDRTVCMHTPDGFQALT